MIWIAVAALTLLNAYNWLLLLRLERRVEQLTWLDIANPPTEPRKTRWPPSTGQERKP